MNAHLTRLDQPLPVQGRLIIGDRSYPFAGNLIFGAERTALVGEVMPDSAVPFSRQADDAQEVV